MHALIQLPVCACLCACACQFQAFQSTKQQSKVHACMHTRTPTHTHAHTCTRPKVHTCLHSCACTDMTACLCVCVRVCMPILGEAGLQSVDSGACMQVHAHTHAHTACTVTAQSAHLFCLTVCAAVPACLCVCACIFMPFSCCGWGKTAIDTVANTHDIHRGMSSNPSMPWGCFEPFYVGQSCIPAVIKAHKCP